MVQKRRVTFSFSTLIFACCIFGDFVFDLIIGYMYYLSYYQHVVKLCCFYAMLVLKFIQYTKIRNRSF